MAMMDDVPVSVSIANTENWKDAKWVRWDTTFANFVNVLIQQPCVTNVTFDEYQQLPHAEQGGIKNVGGFVGATFNDTVRRQSSFVAKTMITLDIDYPDRCEKGKLTAEKIWQHVSQLGYVAATYTTHSASEDNPRMRIVIPLLEAVAYEEAAPLARAVMWVIGLGMDIFDETSDQPERLMFIPAHAKNGYYYCNAQDGKLLDGRAALASFYDGDYLDQSRWPRSKKEIEAKTVFKTRLNINSDYDRNSRDHGLSLAAVFNQTFTIDDAIDKFLYDLYDHVRNDRYTYRHSTSGVEGGFIAYSDGGFYSHHESDPARSPLSYDAYGLVATHLFGTDQEAAVMMNEWIKDECEDVYGKWNEIMSAVFDDGYDNENLWE